MASDAHTGAKRACPAGYATPAAMGTAITLYIIAHIKLVLTRLSTFLERSLKMRRLLRFEDTRMNEALDIATSLPDPMAIPMSLAASAGASLIPSPTIATIQR